MNNFPPTGGISEVISPRQIVYGTKLDMTKQCRIEFGAYAQIFTGTTPTNRLAERTEAGICLGPVDNAQGSVKFLVVRSGKVVVRRQFTELPITNAVIDAVNNLGKNEDVPTFLTFDDIQDDPSQRDEYFPDEDEIDSDYDSADYVSDYDTDAGRTQYDSGTTTGVEDDNSSDESESENQEIEPEDESSEDKSEDESSLVPNEDDTTD